MSVVRTRFAPSPTGHVHIGNMRAAIYNWLYARHCGGTFLLRVEDTDLERSTQEAIDTLLDAMEWLGLDYDEEAVYQSKLKDDHLVAAKKLEDKGQAYRFAKGDGAEATLFRIPFDCENVPGVNVVGPVTIAVHPDEKVYIDFSGIRYFAVSKKGKPAENEACLAGFKDLKLIGANGEELFSINENIDAILAETAKFEIEGAVEMRFTRREISYEDMVKGRLAKPLDSMKDMVIVRSDGTPVFHIANVCDDVTQNVTHIIRGDDHVENTYRHIFLFHGLDYEIPKYGHLPMIVNKEGKPFSKRDGDAFVGDFRAKGFLGETLFNYLLLLGWNPGDDREVMTMEEMVKEFEITKVQSSPAQMDFKKLEWMNGEYLKKLPAEVFVDGCKAELAKNGINPTDEAYLKQVLDLVSDRIKLFADIVPQTSFFFTDDFAMDEGQFKKRIQKDGVKETLQKTREILASIPEFTAASTDAALHKFVEESGIAFGQVMPPIRISVSGQGSGPDLFPMLELLGREKVLARIDSMLEKLA